jgi:hypothetical protein
MKPGMAIHKCSPKYMKEDEVRGLQSKADSRQKTRDSITKITEALMTGLLAQMVECLPSIYQALSSKPSTEKKSSLLMRKLYNLAGSCFLYQ